MRRVSDVFKSKYLRASDLQGRSVELTIDRVEMDEVGGDQKPVAYFEGKNRGLVLNQTNARAIETLAGEDMDAWTGTRIELFSTPVSFKGQVTDGIRVRPLNPAHTKKEAPAATPAPSYSDPDESLDL